MVQVWAGEAVALADVVGGVWTDVLLVAGATALVADVDLLAVQLAGYKRCIKNEYLNPVHFTPAFYGRFILVI